MLSAQKESSTLTWPYQENPTGSTISDWDDTTPLAIRNRLKYAFFIGAAICFAIGSLFFIFLAVRPMVRFKENTPRHMRSTFIARQSASPHHWILRAFERIFPCLVCFGLTVKILLTICQFVVGVCRVGKEPHMTLQRPLRGTQHIWICQRRSNSIL